MKRVFADTAYWLALTNSFDQYHTKAVEVSEALGPCRLFTTDLVLTEYLNALADKSSHIRAAAVKMVETILRNPHVAVIPMSRRMFTGSLTLYRARLDKGYSLTDCSSMLLMRDRRLSEALTTDRHLNRKVSQPCCAFPLGDTQPADRSPHPISGTSNDYDLLNRTGP